MSIAPAPLVAIIGRPNVGKSTLFNRLAGKRLALVDPTPGLTRDRKIASTELFGRQLMIVDTAGLEEADPDTVTAKMREQSETAIRDADLVLFVIDSREGITHADKIFAKLVRQSGKPVILVANKCEGRAGADGFYEAYELGFGEPTPISAEHGEGIGDLSAEILSALGKEEKVLGAEPIPEPERRMRVAIVGRPNAGKSTLVNTILGEERMIVSPEAGTTRDAIAVDVDWKGTALRLFDTAGLRRKARITERVEQLAVSDTLRAIRFAEVVVLLVDAEHPFEKQDLQIGELITEEGRGLVIGVNKWDAVTDKQEKLKELREDAERFLPQAKGVPIIPMSARSGAGVDKLLAAVEKVYNSWNTRVPTAKLNQWLQWAVEQHSPPAASGRTIRLRFMTQASARPPTFVAFCSKPDDLPKSYVRYLVNSLRDAFDLPAVPIRFHLRKGENPYSRAD